MNYGGFFDFDTKQTRLSELTRLLEDPAIWNDSKRTQEIGREKKLLEDTVFTLQSMEQQLHDAQELFQIAKDESDGAALERRGNKDNNVEKVITNLEFRSMFSYQKDTTNCFVDIKSGSGIKEKKKCETNRK